jgi:hypothetical protein
MGLIIIIIIIIIIVIIIIISSTPLPSFFSHWLPMSWRSPHY